MLKFHLFKDQETQENYYFYPVNNREVNLFKSGFSKITRVLSKEYDKIEYGVSTSLRHKIVYEEIEKFSVIEEKKEASPLFVPSNSIIGKAMKKKPSGFSEGIDMNFSKNFMDYFDPEDDFRSKKKPFVEVSDLRRELLKFSEDYKDIDQNLNQILCDLRKLGLIIYFDNDILRSTIITNPQWFNSVFK